VDGTGEGSEAYANQIREWLPLASADPAVFDVCREVYLHQKREDPAAIAAFLKWSKKLDRPVVPR
jgi:hypothetical protein